MVTIDPDPGRAVADFHTGFNLVTAAICFPLLSPFAGLLRRWLPARVDAADPATPMYLDKAAYETPVVALGGAAREALRLADVLEAMLHGFAEALERGDRRRVAETKRLDDVLDRLDTEIKSYLTGLDPDAMSEIDHDRAREILAFALNLEAAGDVVDKNLLASVAKQIRRGLAMSKDAQAELAGTTDRLIGNVRAAASLIMTRDARAARLLAAEKQIFRDLEARATELHFERIRSGETDVAETSALHLELLRDLKRVNTYLVAAAAYPVLESNGELLSSRVRQGDGAVEETN
jgi:phosphate:Na+ symporter